MRIIIILCTCLLLNSTTASAMSLSSRGSVCKANVSFSLPSVNVGCDADPRSGNPSSWINPNTQCDMTFSMLSLPSLGDIAGNISGQVCSALNKLKNMTYDKALDKLQSKIPDNLTDALDLDLNLDSTFSSMINDQLSNTIKQGQTAVENAAINATPTADEINDEISNMLGRDVCFSADDGGLTGIDCGETLAQQIATSSMTAQDKASLEHTTLPLKCKKDEYYDHRAGIAFKYSCKELTYDERGQQIIVRRGYESLTILQARKSDDNGCFTDNLKRSMCAKKGKGAINYNQGYFAATAGTIPVDCEKKNGLFVCPANIKLAHKSIPKKCSFSSNNYYCDDIRSAQEVVQDEFSCFATLNNQRACLNPIDHWSDSYPIKNEPVPESIAIPMPVLEPVPVLEPQPAPPTKSSKLVNDGDFWDIKAEPHDSNDVEWNESGNDSDAKWDW